MDQSKGAEQKLQVLQHQNQRLAVQLEEKRKSARVLEDKVTTYEQKEQDYEHTLLCVNRIWGQLTDAITHLCSSLSIPAPAASAIAVSVRDPFLQRLISDPAQAKPLLDAQKRLDADLSEVEVALAERSRSAKESLASVLDAMRGLHAHQQELSAEWRAAAAAPSPEAAQQALAQDNERLEGEARQLRQQLDTLHALHASTSDELRLAEDRHLEAEERISKMQNELADAEQELSNVQKKYLALKISGPVALGPGIDGGAGPSGLAGGVARTGSIVSALAAHDPVDFLDDAVELQALLSKRAADLDREKEAHLRTKRELQDALARVGDEAWVPSTRTYAIAQQQVAGLQEALAAKARELEGLARERDEALREAQAKASTAAAEAHARFKLATLERWFRELQFAKAEADRLRCDAEAALAAERARAGSAKTVSELQQLVATLQQQVAGMQQRAKLDKVPQDRLEEAAQFAAEAASRLMRCELEAARLRETLAGRDGDRGAWRRQELLLNERLLDLQAFVDVLTTYCSDPRDVAEVRASEAALREQVQDLKQQLQGHQLQAAVRQAEAAELAAKQQLDAMAAECDALRVQVASSQRQAGERAAQLAHCRSECELYTSEIETTAAAFEEMQAQNARLLQQLVEREEATNAVVAERLRLSQQATSLSEAADSARAEVDRMQREVSELGNVREALERDLGRLSMELAQAKEQLRQAATKLDAASADARRRELEAAAAAAQVDALQKQLEARQKQVDEASEKQLKEKTKRQRLEEELKAAQAKAERLKKLQTPAGAAREMQEEVDAMRQLLNCNVCHERQKNVIITKCCHVFCDKCIKRNLEARNRKCPGCGIMYSQGDVKNFFFT